MDKIKDVLLDGEEIIFSGSPSYKMNKDYLTWASLILVIVMEISLYFSIRPSLYYIGLKVFIIVFFVVEDIYLFFTLRSKRLNKIRYQKNLLYCLTNKRIFTYNMESNSLMIEKLESCHKIVPKTIERAYGTVEFYNDKDEIIMSFENIKETVEVANKALKARDELNS